MAKVFYDTSARVKYYHSEAGTPVVSRLMNGGQNVISVLGFVEAQAAFAAKVRSGEISKDAAGVLRARLLLDIAAGDLNVIALTRDHFDGAARLVGRHSFTHRLRTLDALQLATATDLHKQGIIDRFVVADQALVDVATLEGISVLNPMIPSAIA